MSVGAVVDLKLAVIGGTLALGFGEVFFDAVRHEVDARAGLGYLQGSRWCPSRSATAPLVGAAAGRFAPHLSGNGVDLPAADRRRQLAAVGCAGSTRRSPTSTRELPR